MKRAVSLVLVVSMIVACLFLSVSTTRSATPSVRRFVIEARSGQQSFTVVKGTTRVAARFPAGALPVVTSRSASLPLRALVEAAGGSVRFEKAQNTVYFALGPIAGAYEFKTGTFVDSRYTSSVRKDLMRRVGSTGILYVDTALLAGLVTTSGDGQTFGVKVTDGKATITMDLPAVVKDVLGNELPTFPAKAGTMRLVTLAPNLAEDCFALGQGSNIIATSEYTDYPAEARKIPTVGAFSSPSLERLLVLSPDLILVARGTPREVVDRLQKMGRKVYVEDPTTVLQVVDAIRTLSIVIGVPDRGFELALSMRRAVDRVAAAARLLRSRPSVYVEIWNSPLMSAGKNTFLSDLIALAGGYNIGDDTDSEWPVLSEEFIIAHNPDVIVVGSGMGAGEVTTRPTFSTISAVKRGHVYDILGDLVFRPSPRLIQGLELIAGYVQAAAQP
jgi:iron complex transport system substrate-binding protein